MAPATRELTTLISGYSFLESPRWHDHRLWLSDFYTYQVLAVSLDGQIEKVTEVPGQPSGLGWLPDGRMLIVSMRDKRLLVSDGNRFVEYADLSAVAASHLNDMIVDSEGRAYVGNFGSDILAGAPVTTTNLIRVDPDRSTTVVAEDLGCPNGAVITPEGRTMLLSESFANRITAFDIAPDGSLLNRRPWAVLAPPPTTSDFQLAISEGQLPFVPDGMTLDAEGAVWVADALNNRVLRLRGDEVLEELRTGDILVVACALGGEDGRTLFLCASPHFAEDACRADHQARILTTEVEVPAAGLP